VYLPAKVARALAKAAILAALCLALTAPANAEPPTMDTSYAAGKEALKAGDTVGALSHFKAALRLADADERGTWQMLLAIAVTYQRLERPEFAVEYYQRFLKRSDEYRDALTIKWSKRRAMAETDIAKLETTTRTTHGFVTVLSEPPGAAIFLGTVQAGADRDARTTFGMYLRAGSYAITLKREGFKDATRTVDVAEGKLVAIKISLESVAPRVTAIPAAESPVDAGVTATLGDDDDVNLGPWLTLGTGGAVAIASVVLGVLASGVRSDWDGFVETYEREGGTGSLASDTAEYRRNETKTKDLEMGVGIAAGLAAWSGSCWTTPPTRASASLTSQGCS